MKLVYSGYAIEQLENILSFLVMEQGVPFEKSFEIRQQILDKVDFLLANPWISQREENLDKLKLDHRKIISGHYKIIYIVQGDSIIITDIFDTHQDPRKMRG